MSGLDIANCVFQYGAAAFILMNCLRAWKAGQVRGVSLESALFFLIWAAYSLVFFAGLEQPYSFVGAVGLLWANMFWALTVFCLGKR